MGNFGGTAAATTKELDHPGTTSGWPRWLSTRCAALSWAFNADKLVEFLTANGWRFRPRIHMPTKYAKSISTAPALSKTPFSQALPSIYIPSAPAR